MTSVHLSKFERDTHHAVKVYRDFFKTRKLEMPALHVVLGSGIGSSLKDSWITGDWENIGTLSFAELPALATATAPGHAGLYRFLKHRPSQRVLTLQVGRIHGYEGHSAARTVRTVMVPAFAGTRRFVLSNAAGSLHREWPVGGIMMISDHVNLTGDNPLVGEIERDPKGEEVGPRFPDVSEAYHQATTAALRARFEKAGLFVAEGTYLGLMGPNFETPAEIKLFCKWGLDAVGMSTVWETLALNHVGAEVSGFSLLSNLGCGLAPERIDHTKILEASRASARKVIEGLLAFAATEFLR
jgi:purine-nucleoside phosphorylase